MLPDSEPASGVALRMRRTVRVLWLLVVAVVVATAAVVALDALDALGDDTPRARVGEVFRGYSVDPVAFVDRPAIDVALPLRHSKIWVDAPGAEPVLFNGREASFRRPDGGSMVSLYLQRDAQRALRLATTSQHPLTLPEIELRVGDRAYFVEGAGEALFASTDLRAYTVAVDGEPGDLERSDLSLAISLAGVTQVIDLGEDAGDDVLDAGPATPLYDQPTLALTGNVDYRNDDTPCGKFRWSGQFGPLEDDRQPTCRVIAQLRTTYVEGIGWAEPGQEFLAVYVAREDPNFGIDARTGARYKIRDGEVEYRLDGVESLDAVSANALATSLLTLTDPDEPDQAIFRVPADSQRHELEVIQHFVGVAHGSVVGELAPDVTIASSVELTRPTGGA
jgi:hypothetical protein